MCVCTPEVRAPFCGKPGCQWPEQAGELVVCVDPIGEKLDEMADLCEVWKSRRRAALSARAVRLALIAVAAEVTALVKMADIDKNFAPPGLIAVAPKPPIYGCEGCHYNKGKGACTYKNIPLQGVRGWLRPGLM